MISVYPVNEKYIGIEYDGQHIHPHVNDVTTIIQLLCNYKGIEPSSDAANARIAALESELAKLRNPQPVEVWQPLKHNEPVGLLDGIPDTTMEVSAERAWEELCVVCGIEKLDGVAFCRLVTTQGSE